MNITPTNAPNESSKSREEEITKAITTPLADMAPEAKPSQGEEDPRDQYFRGGKDSLLGPAISAPKHVQKEERAERQQKSDSIRPLA